MTEPRTLNIPKDIQKVLGVIKKRYRGEMIINDYVDSLEIEIDCIEEAKKGSP